MLLPASGYRRMPWKNGGGETFEIAVSPPGASLEGMDWRISMAVVASDGPFSSFPGVDRTLTILDGEGLQLDVGAGHDVLLSTDSAPLHFPADVPTSARLVQGTVTDLNVMTRRQSYRHAVQRMMVEGHHGLPTAAAQAAVFCIAGAVHCASGSEAPVLLQARDCAVFHSPAGVLELVAPQSATVLVAEFFPA